MAFTFLTYIITLITFCYGQAPRNISVDIERLLRINYACPENYTLGPNSDYCFKRDSYEGRLMTWHETAEFCGKKNLISLDIDELPILKAVTVFMLFSNLPGGARNIWTSIRLVNGRYIWDGERMSAVTTLYSRADNIYRIKVPNVATWRLNGFKYDSTRDVCAVVKILSEPTKMQRFKSATLEPNYCSQSNVPLCIQKPADTQIKQYVRGCSDLYSNDVSRYCFVTFDKCVSPTPSTISCTSCAVNFGGAMYEFAPETDEEFTSLLRLAKFHGITDYWLGITRNATNIYNFGKNRIYYTTKLSRDSATLRDYIGTSERNVMTETCLMIRNGNLTWGSCGTIGIKAFCVRNKRDTTTKWGIEYWNRLHGAPRTLRYNSSVIRLRVYDVTNARIFSPPISPVWLRDGVQIDSINSSLSNEPLFAIGCYQYSGFNLDSKRLMTNKLCFDCTS